MAQTDTVPMTASQDMLDTAQMTIADYLISRLQEYGIRDVFGIPGDYILTFYSQLERSRINTIGCTREDNAGFAADAYARVNGMGAVCVTYCVGGLSICNSIAGAYAEKSPVVVLTGSPGMGERVNNPLLHHMVRDFRTQLEVFEKLCIAGTELNDPLIAFREIDRVLDAVSRFKRPGYIELPRDMVSCVPGRPHQFEKSEARSNPDALAEAVAEARERISNCSKPVILAGVELHRFNLQDELLQLAEAAQIPITTTMLGKSVIRETHPLFAGMYEGAMGREEITRYVEESDCVILLGTFMTDINMGIFTANLDPARCIYATSEQLRIRHHHYHDVRLDDFIRALAQAQPSPPTREPLKVSEDARYQLQADQQITIERLVGRLNESLDDNTVVIADVGDALFAATELVVKQRTEFISPAYYTSMGFGVPAALGAQVANKDLRPVVLVGDGAFQMTCLELSTIIRNGFNPIVIVLDNGGYGTERMLHPGDFEYNEIHGWNYHKLTDVLRGGTGYEASTEGEFDQALNQAWADNGLSLIQVHLPRDDGSQALKRLAERLGKIV